MLAAIFREDLDFEPCPIYIHEKETGIFRMKDNEEYYFKEEEVIGNEDFVLVIHEPLFV